MHSLLLLASASLPVRTSSTSQPSTITMQTTTTALIPSVFLEHHTCTVLHGVTLRAPSSKLARSFQETTILAPLPILTSLLTVLMRISVLCQIHCGLLLPIAIQSITISRLQMVQQLQEKVKPWENVWHGRLLPISSWYVPSARYPSSTTTVPNSNQAAITRLSR